MDMNWPVVTGAAEVGAVADRGLVKGLLNSTTRYQILLVQYQNLPMVAGLNDTGAMVVGDMVTRECEMHDAFISKWESWLLV